MGKKKGLEEGLKKSNEERLNGIDDGTRLGESEERGRWLAEGHGPGLCSKTDDERRKGREEGLRDGELTGKRKEKEIWATHHGEGRCLSVQEHTRALW